MSCLLHIDDGRAPLPDSVAEIAEVIGRDQALRLVGALPPMGARSWRVCFYVPKDIGLDHQLVTILGYRDAMRMVRHFGGEILQVSNCSAIRRAFHRREIHRLSAQGQGLRAIARTVGLTERQVRNILSEEPPEELP